MRSHPFCWASAGCCPSGKGPLVLAGHYSRCSTVMVKNSKDGTSHSPYSHTLELTATSPKWQVRGQEGHHQRPKMKAFAKVYDHHRLISPPENHATVSLDKTVTTRMSSETSSETQDQTGGQGQLWDTRQAGTNGSSRSVSFRCISVSIIKNRGGVTFKK